MLSNIKKLFVFGWESRVDRAVNTVKSAVEMAPVLAMQSLGEWLVEEVQLAERHRDGLAVLRAIDSDLRIIAEAGLASLIDSHTNHTRSNLLLQAMVPFFGQMLDAYTSALSREMVELARKPANAGLVQASVSNWLYWMGRDHVVRYVREPKDDRLPWHEIRPASEFALGLGGGLAAKLSRPDGESGRLQKQLSYLVLLSRSLTPDFQGRQLLIADRLADALASFIRISNQHSEQTPFGQATDDNNPPTVLTQMPTKSAVEGTGLFYGLEKGLQELIALEYLIVSQNSLPPKIDPDKKLNVAEALAVIKHLKNRWAGREVKRQAERKLISGTLNIAYDFGVIRRLVVQANNPESAAKNRTVETNVERAVVEDVSSSGVGLKLVKHPGWLKMGQLMGVRTEKDLNWRIGIVRRAISRGHGEMFAGIQLLARDPESIRLTRKAQVSQWERVSEVESWDNLLALYLRPEALNEQHHILICAKPELEVGRNYTAPGTREGDLVFRVSLLQEIASDCVLYRCERLPSPATTTVAQSVPGLVG
ncbi:hypothetical protein [Chitinimonas sp.]|uniref:hypothetical protein n=1 Tax=Chitinimonas sp. TaxID=1934313 RepID=UPI0035AF0932